MYQIQRFHVHDTSVQCASFHKKIRHFNAEKFKYLKFETTDLFCFCFVPEGTCWRYIRINTKGNNLKTLRRHVPQKEEQATVSIKLQQYLSAWRHDVGTKVRSIRLFPICISWRQCQKSLYSIFIQSARASYIKMIAINCVCTVKCVIIFCSCVQQVYTS